ncbi:hypothetical protein D9M72_641540 [compost metagenome]
MIIILVLLTVSNIKFYINGSALVNGRCNIEAAIKIFYPLSDIGQSEAIFEITAFHIKTFAIIFNRNVKTMLVFAALQ